MAQAISRQFSGTLLIEFDLINILPVMPDHSDVPNDVLKVGWTKTVEETYNIKKSQFYLLRKAREIESVVGPGRPNKVAKLDCSRKAVEQACSSGDISERTARRCLQLSRGTPSKASQRTQEEHEQGKLCAIYDVSIDSMDRFLAHFMMTLAFAREFLRLGIDPLRCSLEWASTGFPVKRFCRILTARNTAVKSRPCIHQALFGQPGREEATSMHHHNWWLQDDAAHKELVKLVRKWQQWNVDVGVQVQLVSLTCVYNGKHVAASLQGCTCITELPIKLGQLIPEMCDSISSFIAKVWSSGHNPFSVRFRTYAYNACKDPAGPQARAMVGKVQREVLTHIEAISLPHFATYTGRLTMLSRTKGYSDNIEASFLGKNLINTLSALGEECPHLSAHIVAQKEDHPNGPGASAYFDLRSSETEMMNFRSALIADLKKMWPSDIKVDGVALDTLHLGRDPDREVQGETVQFAACAALRVVHHVLTGVIAAHLLRNAVIAKREAEEREQQQQREAAQLKKKPAQRAGRGRGACQGRLRRLIWQRCPSAKVEYKHAYLSGLQAHVEKRSPNDSA